VELIKFKELESKLKNLIDEYSSLKKKNLERDSVRTKVDSLLDLLQDISVPK